MESQSTTIVDASARLLPAFCEKWKIQEVSLFGSGLTPSFGAFSDVDLLVTFAPDADWSLMDHVRMTTELEEALGRKVDLVSRRAVERSSNWIRRRAILESARVMYAA